jgi:hypothetical protein
MTKHSMLTTLALSSTLLLTACGGGSSSGSKNPSPVQNEVSEDFRGTFTADLKPMNMASPEMEGQYLITLNDDVFQVQTTILKSAPGVRHFQYIIQGKCNFIDQNNDTLIDMSEIIAQGGGLLVPLDSNLETQIDGSDFGPIANEEGKFVYKKSADPVRFLDDLTAADPDSRDEFIKISSEKDLRMNTRSVLVLGLEESAALPDTISEFRNLSRAEGFPVGCGEIQRSN